MRNLGSEYATVKLMTEQQAIDRLEEELERLVPYTCEARPDDYGNRILVIVDIPGCAQPFTDRRFLSELQSESDIHTQAENIQAAVELAASMMKPS